MKEIQEIAQNYIDILEAFIQDTIEKRNKLDIYKQQKELQALNSEIDLAGRLLNDFVRSCRQRGLEVNYNENDKDF